MPRWPWRGRAPEPRLEPLAVMPVGVVRNGVREPRMSGWEGVTSEILLREELAGALDGIEGFSHIIVLFWLHRVPENDRRLTHIHPLGDPEVPIQGVFATRTQNRPNPIGVAVVPLLERKGRRLRVRGLDAIDGTPVLDLKPYVPHHDSVPEARLPAWAREGPKARAGWV
ncbi:MAG TPA: tRNA (N6-threonylcarbamoyladenosine(37)-N6)-methyltransferase TrmO [Dehalococcoidia bacterium]|nr:tRNA (N6-threonylcarbamoyladenosine(37)-N6)-methyltransferase TrmO [Dehalococcoidia bacterium]HLB29792.1 tRNA (N6-threonylcarbamoyladenosine(37)-N6)-methyltransferase TrmO [Dehalococcoidia bacterium]